SVLAFPGCRLDSQSVLGSFQDALSFANHFDINCPELTQPLMSFAQVVAVSAFQSAEEFVVRTIQGNVWRPPRDPLPREPTVCAREPFHRRKCRRIFQKLCQYDHVARV